MFFFRKYHFINFFFIFFILSNCKLQEHRNTHGIAFLENRSNKLISDTTNKNDVVNILGLPQIKDKDKEKKEIWIYLERTLAKGKYYELGKHKLENNNVLYLTFNKYGILSSKEFLSKEKINKISFSKKFTENDISQKSFMQNFLQSIKTKMYGNRK